jgi:hypothetical protein
LLGGDVLGGEVRPRRREEHRHVDRLNGEPALNIPPEDRLPEEADPRQPYLVGRYGWMTDAVSPRNVNTAPPARRPAVPPG